MTSRPIQIGDIAQVVIENQSYNIPIDLIDSQGIHASSHTIVPQDNTWQVQDYLLPHSVAFFPFINTATTTPTFVPQESPIFAVYSRTGPRKILMLLKPRANEVTYTPSGIQLLKLDTNKLPPYALITNSLARNEQQFVLLPYVKGRSEQEIEQLIAENPPQTEYQINDIIAEQIYKGEYGLLPRVSQNLRSVIPCQKDQSILLQQALRGSPFYQGYIEDPKTFHDLFKLGEIMLGKNNDYIITSDLGFESILKDIRNCGRVYYLVGVTKDLIMASEFEDMAHAMAIVIDPQTKTLEVFDPNGFTPDTRHVYFWATQLINYLREHGIEVERRITADEPFCPQSVSAFASEFRGEEQCLVWSFWYIWLRVNNPTVPAEAIRRYMARMTPQKVFDRIRRIATIAFDS